MPQPDPRYQEALEKERQDNIVKELLPRLERERLQFLSPDFQPNATWWGSKVE